MKITIIACNYQTGRNKEPCGFRIFDASSGEKADISDKQLYAIIASKKATVVNAEIYNGTLRGSNGTFDRYTKFVKWQLRGPSRLVILREIGDIGYEVCDHNGVKKKFSLEDTIKAAEMMGIANGKLVTQADGTKYISPIKGVYEKIPQSEVDRTLKNKAKQAPSNTIKQPEIKKDNTVKGEQKARPTQVSSANQKPQQTPVAKKEPSLRDRDKEALAKGYSEASIRSKMPSIRGTEVPMAKSRLKEMTPEDMSVEQKMMASYLILKRIRPFYYAVMQTLKRRESVEIPTMAVSLDTFYYNTDFVKDLPISNILFIQMHEMCHIMMRHQARRGIRDPEMWNIACDLYINKVLCEECGIKSTDPEVELSYEGFKYKLEFPKIGLYDARVDINKDTPESIYSELEKESRSNQQKVSANINNQNNENGQGNSQGQGSGDSNSQQNNSGQPGGGNQPSQNQSGNGNGQSSQSQPGQGNQGTGLSNGKGSSAGSPGQNGQGSNNGTANDGNDSGEGNQGQSGPKAEITLNTKEYIWRGTKITDSTQVEQVHITDMVEDETAKNASENTKRGIYESVMKRAKVLEKQMQAGKGKGHSGVAEAFVDEELIPKINWRNVLMNRLISMMSDEKSLSTPDRRFIHSGLYVEGRRMEDEKLEDIKIAIDTSGSMTDLDIAVAFGQIKQLLKTYKTSAEIIFWDDGVQDIIGFDDYNSLKLAQARAKGRGGTNPNCIFELFETDPDYKRGVRPKPALIIIFTDGIFNGPDMKYKSKYGRDTLWVISQNYESSMNYKVTLPFGKVAKLKDQY